MTPSRPPWARLVAGFVLVLIGGAASARPVPAQGPLGLWDPRPGPLVADIRAGIDAAYDFDYGEALRRFDHVVAVRPDHPAGRTKLPLWPAPKVASTYRAAASHP